LLTFAGNQMALAEKQSDGATLREHLQAVARQIRKMPPELAELTAVRCPVLLQYLWQAFLELSSARGSTGFGPAPLSFLEIESWSRLTHRTLTGWQINVLKQLDSVYLSKQAEQAKKNER
jgi:hypothetical protein